MQTSHENLLKGPATEGERNIANNLVLFIGNVKEEEEQNVDLVKGADSSTKKVDELTGEIKDIVKEFSSDLDDVMGSLEILELDATGIEKCNTKLTKTSKKWETDAAKKNPNTEKEKAKLQMEKAVLEDLDKAAAFVKASDKESQKVKEKKMGLEEEKKKKQKQKKSNKKGKGGRR